jgi:hypothetical protein
MSDCKLIEYTDNNSAGTQGTTLVTDGKCIQPTAIYLPKNHDKNSLNVILWLHGFYVSDYRKHILCPDETDGPENKNDPHANMLRESVDDSKQDVVLIAPWVGHAVYGNPGNYGLGNLAGKNGLQRYLDEILGLLAVYLGMDKTKLSSQNIERLAIACHSGGGNLMRQLTPGLGDVLGPKLKECWGFDCFYASGHDYGCWADSLPSQLQDTACFYFYLATGSSATAFVDFWKFAYGTPGTPEPQRMNNVFLAPGLQSPVALESLTDHEVFQSFDALDHKGGGEAGELTDYEAFRLELDSSLDGKTSDGRPAKQTWSQMVSGKLKTHYMVVRDLMSRRIDGLFDTTKPSSGTNVIAQLRSCVQKQADKKKASKAKQLVGH